MTPRPYIILVGTDYAAHSVRALRIAVEQAKQHPQAEVHVAHAEPAAAADFDIPLLPFGGMSPRAMPSARELRQELEFHVQATLNELQLPPTLRVITHLLVGQPAAELTRLGKELAPDLMVVGTRGHHGLKRVLSGSVSRAVQHAGFPLLIAEPEPRSEAPRPEVPAIEPPCPDCVAARIQSGGSEMWCAQHSVHHGRRHTYHQGDRMSSPSNFPLVGH